SAVVGLLGTAEAGVVCALCFRRSRPLRFPRSRVLTSANSFRVVPVPRPSAVGRGRVRQPAAQSITAPINATTQSGGVINGVFQVTSFTVNQAGQLVANGVLNGTLTAADGTVTNLVNTGVSSVVTN